MILQNYASFRTVFAAPGPLDSMGYPRWDRGLLRRNGFAELTGVPQPITVFPIVVTCNGGAADGGAAYDWYLSQRTDDVTKKFLLCYQLDVTHSGSCALAPTALALSLLGIPTQSSPLDEDQVTRLLRHTTLYCQRRSDKSIQLVNLLATALG